MGFSSQALRLKTGVNVQLGARTVEDALEETNGFLSSACKGLATSLGKFFKALIAFPDVQSREGSPFNLVAVDLTPDAAPASGLSAFSLYGGWLILELKPTWCVIAVAGWFVE